MCYHFIKSNFGFPRSVIFGSLKSYLIYGSFQERSWQREGENDGGAGCDAGQLLRQRFLF